jgi:hypothetical protein
MGRHKNLLFAHSRSASLHCSEAPAIPNVLLGMTQLKPLIVNFYVLISSCAKVSNILKNSIRYLLFYAILYHGMATILEDSHFISLPA